MQWIPCPTSIAGRRGLESCSGQECFFHFRDVCRKSLVSYLHRSFIYSSLGHMQSPVSWLPSLLISENKLEKHAKVALGGLTRKLLDSQTGISIFIFSRFVYGAKAVGASASHEILQVRRRYLALTVYTVFFLTVQPWAERGSRITWFINRAAMGRARFQVYTVHNPPLVY